MKCPSKAALATFITDATSSTEYISADGIVDIVSIKECHKLSHVIT